MDADRAGALAALVVKAIGDEEEFGGGGDVVAELGGPGQIVDLSPPAGDRGEDEDPSVIVVVRADQRDRPVRAAERHGPAELDGGGIRLEQRRLAPDATVRSEE